MNKRKRWCPTLDKQTALVICVVLLAMFTVTDGYCADLSSEAQQIDAVTSSVMNTIFSPGIKKAALALGAGAGIFQSWMGGSIKPLLMWGGLGMSVNYVPKIVEIISKI